MWTSGFRRGITVDFAPPVTYFGTDGSGLLIGIILKGPVGCPEASVSRCQPIPCNVPEE